MSRSYSRSQNLSQNLTSREKKFILQHFCNLQTLLQQSHLKCCNMKLKYIQKYTGVTSTWALGMISRIKSMNKSIGWIEGICWNWQCFELRRQEGVGKIWPFKGGPYAFFWLCMFVPKISIHWQYGKVELEIVLWPSPCWVWKQKQWSLMAQNHHMKHFRYSSKIKYYNNVQHGKYDSKSQWVCQIDQSQYSYDYISILILAIYHSHIS